MASSSSTGNGNQGLNQPHFRNQPPSSEFDTTADADPSAPLPMPTTFGGLRTTVQNGSFGDTLVDKLEENYLKTRWFVMNKNGKLITPLKFLKNLCEFMEENIHLECITFIRDGSVKVQFRTEIYVGGFIGVGHALTEGFSKQLAAAHALERMRVHIPAIKQSMYALYPGSRYTRIGGKLDKLCEQYELGEVEVEERIVGGDGGDLEEVKWEVNCFLQNKVATVICDDVWFATCQAKMDMYRNFVSGVEELVVQMKDYFGVGVDCPMLREIHPLMYLNKPSQHKLEWMEEFKVGSSEMDGVLNDGRNESGHLMREGLVNKLVEFKRRVEGALEGMRGEGMRQEEIEMGNAGFPGNGGGGVGEAMNFGRDVGTLDAGNEEDLEVHEIFYDARMEVE